MTPVSRFLAPLLTVRGRTSRRFYCYCLLAYIVLSVLIGLLARLIITYLHPTIGMLVALILVLPLLAAMFCQAVRRYHDFGVTGWVPGGFLIAAFVLNLLRSPGQPLDGTPWAEAMRIGLQALSIIVFVFIPGLVPTTKRGDRYGSPLKDGMWEKTTKPQ